MESFFSLDDNSYIETKFITSYLTSMEGVKQIEECINLGMLLLSENRKA